MCLLHLSFDVCFVLPGESVTSGVINTLMFLIKFEIFIGIIVDTNYWCVPPVVLIDGDYLLG